MYLVMVIVSKMFLVASSLFRFQKNLNIKKLKEISLEDIQ